MPAGGMYIHIDTAPVNPGPKTLSALPEEARGPDGRPSYLSLSDPGRNASPVGPHLEADFAPLGPENPRGPIRGSENDIRDVETTPQGLADEPVLSVPFTAKDEPVSALGPDAAESGADMRPTGPGGAGDGTGDGMSETGSGSNGGDPEEMKRVLFAESARIVDAIQRQDGDERPPMRFKHYRMSEGTITERKTTDPFDASWLVMPEPDPEGHLGGGAGQRLMESLKKSSKLEISAERMSSLMSRALSGIMRDNAVLGAEGCAQPDLMGRVFGDDVAPLVVHGLMSEDITARITAEIAGELRTKNDEAKKQGKRVMTEEEIRDRAEGEAKAVGEMAKYLSDVVSGTGSPEDKAAAQAMYRTIMQNTARDAYAKMMDDHDPARLKKAAEEWKRHMDRYLADVKSTSGRLTQPNDMLSLMMIASSANPAMMALYLTPLIMPAVFAGVSKWRESRNMKTMNATMKLLGQRAGAMTAIEMVGAMSGAMAGALANGEDPRLVMKDIVSKVPELQKSFADLAKQNLDIAVRYPEGKKLSPEETAQIDQMAGAKMAQIERMYDTVGHTVDMSRIHCAVAAAHRVFFDGDVWRYGTDEVSMQRLDRVLRKAAVEEGAEPDPKNPETLVCRGKPGEAFGKYQSFRTMREEYSKAVHELSQGLGERGATLRRPVSLEALRILTDGLSHVKGEYRKAAFGVSTLLSGALLEDSSARKLEAAKLGGATEEELVRETVCSLAAEASKGNMDDPSPLDRMRGMAVAAMVRNDPTILGDMSEEAKILNMPMIEDAMRLDATVPDNMSIQDTFAGSVVRATMSGPLRAAEMAPRLRDAKLENALRIIEYMTRPKESDLDYEARERMTKRVFGNMGNIRNMRRFVREWRDEERMLETFGFAKRHRDKLLPDPTPMREAAGMER